MHSATQNFFFRLASIGAFALTHLAMTSADPGDWHPGQTTAPVAGDTPSGWLAQVENDLAAAEYRVAWQPATEGREAAYQAPNRAQSFRTYFRSGRIHVLPRDEQGSTWDWTLSLHALGRRGAMDAVAAATLSVDGTRIDYQRGDILEWYLNEPRGLEQGFLLPSPPGADSQHGKEVVLELALGGSLSAFPAEDGQSIDFRTAEGARALRYSDLRVTDATGHVLPSRMEAFVEGPNRGIRLIYRDREARYPVTVDPLTTGPVWTAESNQVGANFGVSVATAGDVNGDGYSDVIVGAYLYDNGQANEGGAFLYLGSPAGLSAIPSWTAEGNQVSSRFGFSVATAGDVNGDGYSDVLVGAYGYDNGQTDEGRAVLYLGSASGLGASPSWTAEANQTTALFGVAVAAAGDVNGDGYSDVIVGAQLYDSGESDEGGAFVYLGSAGGLSASASYIAQANQIGAEMGVSVGTAGDVNGDGYDDVIVGELRFGATDTGAAVVFYGSAAGITGAGHAINGTEANALFGNSVATAGDVNGDGYADIVIGAYHHTNGQSQEGLASVYLGAAAGITSTPAWTVESDQAGALYGLTVGTAGDVNGDGYADVVIGAATFDNGQTDEGRAYLYLGSASGLSTTATWIGESDQASAQYGTSVATAGDVNGDGYSDLLVGAAVHDNGEVDEGRAYLYLGSASGSQASAGWTVETDQPGSEYGHAIASAGDVNGDGHADVIVGAYLYDSGPPNRGRIFGYYGTDSGLPTTPDWIADGPPSVFELGNSVAGAGDVNGDGYSDVIVGAFAASNGQAQEGRAFVYHGSVSGLSTTPDWSAEGNVAHQEFGTSVAGAGDVNGDGYADVIVGARSSSSGVPDRVFVFHGSAGGLSTSPAWTIEAAQSTQLGGSVAAAGDVNRDGYSDVIVGAGAEVNYKGRAYLYLGSAAGLSTAPAWIQEGETAYTALGTSCASAGDVDGDGYSDVIVGAPGISTPSSDTGRAYVFRGVPSGLEVSPAWTIEGDQAEERLGSSVASAGDVNGDGYSDLIVGAHHYTNGQADEGRAVLYLGSATGPGTSPAWVAEGNQQDAGFGRQVASAGDVNGDGYSEVIVSALGFPLPEKVSLFYGNGGPGLSLQPEQRRTSDTAPVDRLCASDSTDGFRLGVLARTPFGRGLARLEWEVKPLGSLLDGSGTGVSADSDTGVAGTELSAIVDALSPDALHHWRVRLVYDPVSTPFATRSRWLTRPWNGWQEADLRTAAPAAGRISLDNPDQLRLAKIGATSVFLVWGPSCMETDDDFEVYEGSLGAFESHFPVVCSTGGATNALLSTAPGSVYYLVVPSNGYREGSYGTRSDGSERPQALGACDAQSIATCP